MIALVTDLRRDLLEATIRHLEGLKADGARFVTVSPDAWNSLQSNPRTRGPKESQRELREQPARVPSIRKESPPATKAAFEPPAATPASPSALPPAAKAVAFAALRSRVLPCQKCPHLAASRTTVVFGVGDIDAALMFVGEAPGADEDLQGEPFVGKAGQLLTRIIQTMGLSRETVYIANVLKCRPDTPGQTSGNRKPTAEEMKTCLPYLQEQIELIRPKAIVALGGTAMEGLFGEAVFITRARGKFRDFRGIPVMPTYHPSYLLRNAALEVKRQVWEDMLQVMTSLGMPITEKQQGFFLKAG